MSELLDRIRHLHVLWGIPFGKTAPVVLITAYRPDPSRWHEGFVQRKDK